VICPILQTRTLQALDPNAARPYRRRDRESGQATVEFALILLPMLLLVSGIIWFGIGLNYWLDMQRVANQGARWAVVNSWPGCSRTQAYNTCTGTTVGPNNSLTTYLTSQAITTGLRSSVVVSICYPDDGDPANDGKIGSPVRVQLDSPFKFVPILQLGTIDLKSKVTMRLEQETVPTGLLGNKGHLTGVVACP
jgi:hypothetical protein